jgi:hypothetical protein
VDVRTAQLDDVQYFAVSCLINGIAEVYIPKMFADRPASNADNTEALLPQIDIYGSRSVNRRESESSGGDWRSKHADIVSHTLHVSARCAVLCCAVLCCAVLCCAVLCCVVLCCAVLSCAVLCCPVLSCAVLCCPVLSCAVLCCPTDPFRYSMSCGSLLPLRCLLCVQFVFMGLLLAVYLWCQYFIHVPGCPRGYIGPGGLAASPEHAHCTGGAHRYERAHGMCC